MPLTGRRLRQRNKTMHAGRNRTAFTLVETIAASVILCMAVLALGTISTRSLVSMSLDRQYEEAAALADKQLTYIDYVGIDDFIETGRMQGALKGFGRRYYWKAATAYEGTDDLYKVTVTVSWFDRKRVHSISVATMLNGTGLLLVSTPEE